MCAADKDNLHRIMLQVIRSRRENSSAERGCVLVDAVLSLDTSDAVMSADLLSILIGALTTTVPCQYRLTLLVMQICLH